MNKQYFKISEAAKLTNVSRQTLIYYDKEGILKPSFIDDNKYRYYSIRQIHLIQIINLLKEFHIPLRTIKTYLDHRDQEELLDLLNDIQDQMEKRIQKLKDDMHIIEYKKNQIEKSLKLVDYDTITLEVKKPILVFCGSKLSEKEQNGEGHFKNTYQLENELKKLGFIGLGLDVIVEQQYLKKDYHNHISYFCVNLNTDRTDLNITTIPGGLYVTAYHHGSNQSSYQTYRRMLDYIEKNNLVLDGDAYERNLINYLTEMDPHNYLSEISIKVSPNP